MDADSRSPAEGFATSRSGKFADYILLPARRKVTGTVGQVMYDAIRLEVDPGSRVTCVVV